MKLFATGQEYLELGSMIVTCGCIARGTEFGRKLKGGQRDDRHGAEARYAVYGRYTPTYRYYVTI